MIESKKIHIVVVAATIFALITSILILVLGNVSALNETSSKKAEYSTEIFGNEIISIEIIADESDWQGMLDNAINEEYIMVDVVVNDTMFKSVGIRPKGNSSLTQVVNSDSDRYSFRIKFDEYIKNQTCFGLDTLVVNNMIGDKTYMKEYVSYDLMREIGVDASEFGFADIMVNGEDWGLYFAIELYGTSYKDRVYNDVSGALYNVKNTQMEAGQHGMDDSPQMPDGDFPQKPDGDSPQMGEGGSGGSGGSLEYTDDKIESYSSIFDNVVGKGTKKEFKRVIKALEKLSEGEELEKYFDVDKILRYLAAHTIVVNLDSYSSNMAQNYYLYEHNGQITILPWDYNLAWGGFQSGNASSVINFPIDTPVSNVEMSSRPLIDKLLQNSEYLDKYHDYLQELITNYFSDGKFEEKITSLDNLISSYVEKDKTAFCSFQEYEKAISSFITLGNLRAESVQSQLDGTIPSTTEEQKENSDKLISSGDLNLSDLGSMMGEGDRNSLQEGSKEDERIPSSAANLLDGMDKELIAKAMEVVRQSSGEITDDVKENLINLGLTADQIEQIAAIASRSQDEPQQAGKNGFSPERKGANGGSGNMQLHSGKNGTSLDTRGIVIVVVLSVLLIAAMVFVARYKKRY